VYPKKANNLVHKPLYKGGVLKSTATVVVHVCGQKKKSVKVRGSSPLFTDRLEFILGECPLFVVQHEIKDGHIVCVREGFFSRQVPDHHDRIKPKVVL
jgi:hypothetical protein